MAFHLPTDLIRQVQIAVRNDAGLSNYDPDDPTLPSLPSFDASVFGLDPSTPAYLRCKNCKGKLLRGVESVICIYCGNQQLNKDLPPPPISFTSTFGYQWLLQSLDLDQSETVGPANEEYESKRGHSIPQQETSLHDLLDLQVTWPDELERPETSVPNKTSEQRSSSLNFNGADLDNVFSGPKRDLASDAFAETVTAKQLDSTESKGPGSVQDSLTLFSGVHSADSGFGSSEDNRGDSFSGWAADFQSENKHEGSNSFDPFVGSTVDLSSHIDSVFGAGKEENTVKLDDDPKPVPSMSLDWMQDDLWKNVDTKVGQQAAHFDPGVESKDGLPQKNSDNPGSLDDGWFEGNQWQTNNNTSEPSNNTIGGPDDPFDEWNDFASSTNAVDLSGNASKNTDNEKAILSEHTSEINLFGPTSNDPDNEFGSFSQPDFFSVLPVNHDGDAVTNNILNEVYAPERSNNSQSHVNELPENGNVLKASTQTTPPKDEVEILMSQMHDLSFMLESDLSVPSKLVDRNSTSQD